MGAFIMKHTLLLDIVLPYIKGVTEPLTRILNNNGIRATTRPVKTLQQEFAPPKSRPPSDRQTNVVYKIPCSDCTWNYIGETSKCLHTRKKEHIRNTKVFKMVPILSAMLGSKATLLILRMHALSTEQIHA